MCNLGDIKISKYYQKFIWAACVDCGKQRWVLIIRGQPQSPRCCKCSPRLRPARPRGKDNPAYKCGYKINKDGYKEILLQPDNFFYPMVKKDGYVLEHRLVMAQSLGRCLHGWEIVHHKKVGNKLDNRCENLQLVSDDRHNQITIMEVRIVHLEKRITLLEAENVALKAEARFQIR